MLNVNTEESIVTYFSHLLTEKLQSGQKVLWLLSGGSAIDVEVEVAQSLQHLDASNLFVALMDERYGAIGHKDENWQKLLDTGFLLPGAQTHRVLTGSQRSEAAQKLTQFLDNAFGVCDYKIGLFGMGTDGHTAGIKPYSPAVNDEQMVVEYTGEDFERITITPMAIRMLNEAVLYVRGSEKDEQLDLLQHSHISIAQQPAQVLKEVPKSILFIAR